ncbi:MAG: ATP-binding protein, partial [Bacteroidia bacterium]|nr:ATP-binding protein [Bacteroidia bacterium]
SHELRTPLNAILGYAQILSDNKNIPDDSREKIKIINKSGEHLLQLINTILDLSKIEAGKMELQFADFNLHTLFQQLYDLFLIRAEKKGLDFQVIISESVPKYMHGDETKLRQCLINLIGNAIKFTNKGFIKVTAEFSEQEIFVSVADSGRGIPREKLADVVKPFSQIQAYLNTEGGTGLGLAITKSYLEMMGAELTVESEVGVGTNFSFKLPYLSPISEPSEITENLTTVKSIELPYPVKVLIVDDNLVNRDVAKEILQPFGFEIQEVESGELAVQKTIAWLPDLILMDIRMPGIGGLEATRQIRSFSQCKNIQIFAVTASAFEHEKKLFLENGCNGYLAKPYRRDDLLLLICQTLGLKYQTDELITESKEMNDFQLKLSKTEIKELLPTDWLSEFSEHLFVGRLEAIKKLAEKLSEPKLIPIQQQIIQWVDDMNFEALDQWLGELSNE